MKLKVGITVVIFVLISLTLIIFRKHLDENLFQLFSLIGSLASLFGLLFVWLQTSDVTEGDISSGKHLYALLAIWIVIGLFLFWSSSNKQVLPTIEPALIEKMVYPLPDKPSIAVLPFDNMTGDNSQDYLSDGISENIISALSGISNLFVIARNSTFTYKDKPVKVQQVSEDLGVRYVLEGSIQKSGRRYRFTVQLIDAIKGNHLWSDKYDRELNDLFMVQDEITKKIITALNVELTQGEQARTISKGTDNLEAYLKVMQAREHIYKHNVESNASAQQAVYWV
jgi:TolB-like protein